MPELDALLEREMLEIPPAEYSIADVAHRCDRHRRNQRIGTAAVALLIAAVAIGALVRAFGLDRPNIPANWPSPSGRAAPILREGEVVEHSGNGRSVVVTDIATGDQRTLARCQGRCDFLSNPAASSDRSWVAYELVPCLGACGPSEPTAGIWVVGAEGPPRQLTIKCDPLPCAGELWSWSPTAPQLAYARASDAGSALFLIDPANGVRTRIATTDTRIAALAWGPDGRSIAYSVKPPLSGAPGGAGSTGVFILRSGEPARRLTGAVAEAGPGPGITWSPDGTRLALEVTKGGRALLVIIGADGSNARTVLDQSSFEKTEAPVWSPDGRRIAYFATPGGQGRYDFEVGVVSADGGERVRLFRIGGSPEGWVGPVWSPDSRRVAFAVGTVVKWFAAPADGSGSATPIDRLEVLRWRQG